jgi:alkylation response protein AidB-like acyl-CoA dehydrogenase
MARLPDQRLEDLDQHRGQVADDVRARAHRADAPKHSGISYILLPMDTPGIEVRPLETMSGAIGENSFNQVFFRDVRVPQANVVGQRGEGWKIANTTLVHERASLNANAEGLLAAAREADAQGDRERRGRAREPVYRDRLLRLQARALAMKHHSMRLLTCGLKGESPAWRASS